MVAGPDGLSPSFVKDGDEVPPSALKELFGSMCAKEEIPKD